MKYIIILLYSIGIIHYSQAQMAMRTYFTSKNEETKITDSALYYREIVVGENQENSISVVERYISTDKIKLYGSYNNIKDKKFVGPKFTAYSNGKIKSKEKFSSDGILIDTAQYYHPNGKLKIAYQYLYKVDNNKTKVTDTLILVFKDSLGNTHLLNGDGYAEIYIETNDLKDQPHTFEKGHFSNHKRVGEWKGSFLNGKYTFVEKYDDYGNLISGVTTDSLNNKITYDKKTFMVQPDYPQGIGEFRKFIGKNYYYTKEAMSAKVVGEVRVSFVVEKDGKISTIKIIKDLGHGTGEEAVKVVRRSKKWNPGIMRGIPVRVSYSLPIRLNLTKI